MSQISASWATSFFRPDLALEVMPEPAVRTSWIAIGATAIAAMKHPPLPIASAVTPQNKANLVTSDTPWKLQWPARKVW
jgi:hypothetical protein